MCSSLSAMIQSHQVSGALHFLVMDVRVRSDPEPSDLWRIVSSVTEISQASSTIRSVRIACRLGTSFEKATPPITMRLAIERFDPTSDFCQKTLTCSTKLHRSDIGMLMSAFDMIGMLVGKGTSSTKMYGDFRRFDPKVL